MRAASNIQCRNGFKVDTTNILFIVGGAFVGVNDIIKKRLNKNATIGFGSNILTKEESKLQDFELTKQIEHKDLIKFGDYNEFMGRFVLTALHDLTLMDCVVY